LRVKLRQVIRRQLRRDADGVSVAAGLNAVVSATVNEPGTTKTVTHSKTRIVQRNGRTEVFETESDTDSENKEANQ
jgi:hypothetical protein